MHLSISQVTLKYYISVTGVLKYHVHLSGTLVLLKCFVWYVSRT